MKIRKRRHLRYPIVRRNPTVSDEWRIRIVRICLPMKESHFDRADGTRNENRMKVSDSKHFYSLYSGNDNDEDDEDDDSYEDDDEDDQAAPTQSRTMNRSVVNSGQNNRKSLNTTANNEDLVVEDLDELNRLYVHPGQEGGENGQRSYTKPIKKKKRRKGMKNGHRHPKLKHWEKMALEQSHQEPCNCRHHVMRLAADQVVYDWCRCKDHQHRELLEKQKQATPPPEPPREPTPPPPPPPRPKPKPRKVQTKSIGINAAEPATTELALAYDPSAVNYDMIQEAIYYRTSSGRLVIYAKILSHLFLCVDRSLFRSNQKYPLHLPMIVFHRP